MESIEQIASNASTSIWLNTSRLVTHSSPMDEFPLSVSMVSWAYNEEDNIEPFLRKAQALMNSLNVDYEHILIDDHSTDQTYKIALAFQKEYPQLRIIRNAKRMDCGWNIRTSVANVTKDVMFWQTVDWSYDISQIRQFLWYLKDFDVVQGVRIKNGSGLLNEASLKSRSDNPVKAIISIINYYVIRTLFRVDLLDFQNVTIYPTRLAKSIQFDSYCSFTNPEMLIKSYWKGARIKQVPITFVKRIRGKAKTRLPTILSSISQILYCWFRWIVLGIRPDKGRGSIASPD